MQKKFRIYSTKNPLNLTLTAGALNILIAPAKAAGVALVEEITLLAARDATVEGKRIMMLDSYLVIMT